MRYFVCVFFLFLDKTGSSQTVAVLSATDSLRIPFASLLVTGQNTRYSEIASDLGVFTINHRFNDSSRYEITVYCFGYEKLTAVYTGSQISRLKTVVLNPTKVKLEEVVITAQYEPVQAEKSVQRIKVIDQEKIQQMGAVNLRDVLTNQLNVRLTQDNILGSGMNLQGLSGENVKILMDGVPVIGRLNGNIDLSQINLANIERIEIVEGPLSVQYGTNALAGTINLITKKERQGVGTKKITGGVQTYYESIGTYNLGVDLSLRFKKQSFQINAGRNYFDGWNKEKPFYFPEEKVADSSRYLAWKPKEQYFGGLSYQYFFKKGEAGFSSSLFDERIVNRGYPRAPFGESAFDDYYSTQRFDNSIFLKRKLTPSWSVNALAAYNYYRRIKKTVFKDLTTLEERLSENGSDQDTSVFTQTMSRASFIHSVPASKLNYELGYDVNYESTSGKRISKELQAMGDYAVFATAEYKLAGKLLLKPGLRYAYNTAYHTPLVPSFHVKWSHNERHAFRGSYAKGFRAPTIKELYFLFVDVNHNIVGNSELRAEQSDNYALSYLYSREINRCRVKIESNFFYNSIYNLITLAQLNASSTEYTYVNIGRYKTVGWQGSAGLSFQRLFIQAGFNYTGRYNALSSESKTPAFTYSPEALLNLTYKIWPRYKTSLAMFYKYTGRLPGYSEVNGQVLPTSVNDYQMLDLTLNHCFLKERLTLTLGCKNFLNVTTIGSTVTAEGAHSVAGGSLSVSTGRNYFVKLLFKL